MTNNQKFDSLEDIKHQLKILKLKRDIAYENIIQNKEEVRETIQPFSIITSIAKPLKKLIVAYVIKKVFK